MARAEPAHGLTQPTKGCRRYVRAARQPVAEHDIVAGSGTDAVGRQQAGDLLDIQRILQRRFRINVACCLQRQGEGKRLGLVVRRLRFADRVQHLARPTGDRPQLAVAELRCAERAVFNQPCIQPTLRQRVQCDESPTATHRFVDLPIRALEQRGANLRAVWQLESYGEPCIEGH